MEKNGIPTQLEKTADNKKDKPKTASTQFRVTETDKIFDEALKAQKESNTKTKVTNGEQQ